MNRKNSKNGTAAARVGWGGVLGPAAAAAAAAAASASATASGCEGNAVVAMRSHLTSLLKPPRASNDLPEDVKQGYFEVSSKSGYETLTEKQFTALMINTRHSKPLDIVEQLEGPADGASFSMY